MSHKVYTRQVRLPRPHNRGVTADDIKSAALDDLRPGEELIRVAFVALDGDDLIIEAGFSGPHAPPETASSPPPAPEVRQVAPPGFKPGQVRSLRPRPAAD